MRVTKLYGYSERSKGEAMLIIVDNKAVAMFEMSVNSLVATQKEMNPKINETIRNITKGWDTSVEKIDHEDFSKIVFENFRYIV